MEPSLLSCSRKSFISVKNHPLCARHAGPLWTWTTSNHISGKYSSETTTSWACFIYSPSVFFASQSRVCRADVIRAEFKRRTVMFGGLVGPFMSASFKAESASDFHDREKAACLVCSLIDGLSLWSNYPEPHWNAGDLVVRPEQTKRPT